MDGRGREIETLWKFRRGEMNGNPVERTHILGALL